MGEFKVSHPDAYALDALCQNFLTCKRKLNEEDIKTIMEKEMVEPIVPASVKQPTMPEGTVVVSDRRRSTRSAVKNAAASHLAESNGTAGVNIAVNHKAGEALSSGNPPNVVEGLNQAIAHGNNMAKETDGKSDTKHSAQGVNPAVAQEKNMAKETTGGTNVQYTVTQAQNAGHNNHNNQGDTAVALAGQSQYQNGSSTSQATYSAIDLQALLVRKIQQGILIPHGCHLGLRARYTLDQAQAHKLLHARYTEFVQNEVTLCYVRISLNSPIFPPERCLFVIYVPRVPGLQELKLYIRRGLEHSRQVPDCRLARVYCILDGGENEIQDLLNSDDKVQTRFRQLAWEQEQVSPYGMKYGARLLPLVEVELEPSIAGLGTNIHNHGAYVGPYQSGHAQGPYAGAHPNGHAQASYTGAHQNVQVQGSHTGAHHNGHTQASYTGAHQNVQVQGSYAGAHPNCHTQASYTGAHHNSHAPGLYTGSHQNVQAQGPHTGPVNNAQYHGSH